MLTDASAGSLLLRLIALLPKLDAEVTRRAANPSEARMRAEFDGEGDREAYAFSETEPPPPPPTDLAFA